MISTGGEGKVSARKRLRGKIGDPSNHPELKHFNGFDTSVNADQFYKAVVVYGIYVREVNDYYGIYRPIPLRWPPLGPAASARIGKRIRIKYLRIKGYIAASPFLITQVRYRLVLYRLRQHLIEGAEGYDQDWLSSLYEHWANLEEDNSSKVIQRNVVRNYYTSYFDVDMLKAQECKRRVLLKGLLKPSADVPNYKIPASATNYFKHVPSGTPDNIDGIALGNQSGTFVHNSTSYTNIQEDVPLIGEYQLHNLVADLQTEINMKSFFPIDVVVNMNDNIDTWNYRYVLVMESDWGVGQNPSGYYDNMPESSNFIFYFIPQIYYTDD